jgi:hypothetical protein
MISSLYSSASINSEKDVNNQAKIFDYSYEDNNIIFTLINRLFNSDYYNFKS